MQNSVMMFTFSVFNCKYLFLANLVQKNENLWIEAKIYYLDYFEYAKFNGGVHFFWFIPETPFWANLVQQIKIVSLSWNLVPRLFRIWRTQWWFDFFCIRPETPFLGKFGPTNQNCRNLVPRLFWICRIQWWCWLFLFYSRNNLFYCLCDRTGIEILK